MPLDGNPRDFHPATQTEPDVFSLDGLIAWLEKQPVGHSYIGDNATACILCQWVGEVIGQPVRHQWNNREDRHFYVSADGSTRVEMTHLEYPVARPQPHTFGAALSRARELRGR